MQARRGLDFQINNWLIIAVAFYLMIGRRFDIIVPGHVVDKGSEGNSKDGEFRPEG